MLKDNIFYNFGVLMAKIDTLIEKYQEDKTLEECSNLVDKIYAQANEISKNNISFRRGGV